MNLEFKDTIIDQLNSPVALADANYTILDVNEAFAQSAGFSREVLLGKSLLDFIPGLSKSGDEETYHFNAKKSFSITLKTISAGSKKRIIVEGVVVAGKTGSALEALGMFSGKIAHDLNNILAGVLGHVSFLRLAFGGNSEAKDSIAAIEAGAKRAASLSHHILEYAKGYTSNFSVLDFSAIVVSVSSVLKGSIPDGVALRLEKVQENLQVLGNEDQLSQLVLNLLVNAKDALSAKGVIEVSLSPLVVAYDEAKALEIQPGNYIKLTVFDNGQGIPQDVADKIFEPFFTTKSSQGTGLGLSTVASIVEVHSGYIRFESEVGKGTVFYVFLPAPQGKKASEVKKGKFSDKKVKQRILVVDDEEAIRTVLAKSLEFLGFEVDAAASGDAALALFSKSSDYSLVILDMIMPGMSGDELFFKLKELKPDIKVLIASGFSSDERTRAILENGGKGYIKKPFTVEELAEEVKRCLK